MSKWDLMEDKFHSNTKNNKVTYPTKEDFEKKAAEQKQAAEDYAREKEQIKELYDTKKQTEAAYAATYAPFKPPVAKDPFDTNENWQVTDRQANLFNHLRSEEKVKVEDYKKYLDNSSKKDTVAETKDNEKKDDISIFSEVIRLTESKDWADYLENHVQVGHYNIINGMELGETGKKLLRQMLEGISKNATERKRVGLSTTWQEADAAEQALIERIANRRAKYLKNAGVKDYKYGDYDYSNKDKTFENYVKNLYFKAESKALSSVYGLEDLDELEKGVLSRKEEKETKLYDNYAAKPDWSENSKDVVFYTTNKKIKGKNDVETALARLMHPGTQYTKEESNEIDGFTAEEVESIRGASVKQKRVIRYLYRTEGAEGVKAYLKNLRYDTGFQYNVIDAAKGEVFKNKIIPSAQNSQDWEEMSAMPKEEEEKFLYDILYNANRLLGLEKQSGGPVSGFNEKELRVMNSASEEEKKVIAYLWRTSTEKEREKNVRRYLDGISKDVLAKRAQMEKEKDEKFADKHPVLAHGKMALDSVVGGVESAVNAVADPLNVALTGKDKPYDVNDPRWDRQKFKEVVTEKAKDNIDSDLGDWMYDTYISIRDNVLRGATAGAVGFALGGPAGAAVAAKYLSPVMMAGGAYESGLYEALSRGADNTTARSYAVVGAATELITEHIGMSKIAEALTGIAKGATSAGRAILSASLSNMGEESAAWAAQLVYDDMLMGEKSTFNQRMAYYKAQGEDKDTAWVHAVRDTAIEGASAAIGGLISGGVMTGAGAAKNKVVQTVQNKFSDGKGNKGVTMPQPAENVVVSEKENTNEETDMPKAESDSEVKMPGEAVQDDAVQNDKPQKPAEADSFPSEVSQMQSAEEVQNAEQNNTLTSEADASLYGSEADAVVSEKENTNEETDMPKAESDSEVKMPGEAVQDDAVQNDTPQKPTEADSFPSEVSQMQSAEEVQNAEQNNTLTSEADASLYGSEADAVATEENQGAESNAVDVSKVRSVADMAIQSLSEGSWSEEKEIRYKNLVKNLESYYKQTNDEGILEDIDRAKDAYVTGKLGTVMSVDAAIEKVKGEEEHLKSLWSKGTEGQEAASDIGGQIRTLAEKRASLETLKAFNEAGFNVKYFSAPENSKTNGIILGNSVYVNLDGEETVKHTVGHEFVHMLKNAGEAFTTYVKAVKKTIDEGTFKKLYAEYTERYGDKYENWNKDMFWEEYAADVAGDLVQDVTYGKSLINAIVSENTTNDVKRSKLRAIGEVLQELIRKMLVAWRKHTGTYKMGEAASYVNNLVEVHKELLRAYNGLEGNKKTADEAVEKHKNVVKFSLSNSKSGRANDSLLPYDDELAGFIKRRGDYIISSFEELKNIVNIAFDKRNEKATAYFGIIPSKILSKIEQSVPNIPRALNGVLFKPGKTYSITATLDSIRHIADEKKLTRDEIIDYLDRMADAIVDFDTVTFDYYYEKGNIMNGLLFKKSFPDGVLTSFEITSNTKRSLNLQSLYMQKGDYIKKKSAVSTLLESQPTADVQDEERSNFNDIVYQNQTNVKRDNLSNEPRMSVSSPDIEERSSMENKAYEIENAVSDRLSEMLEVKLTDATRDAVKVYAISTAMGDEARIRASLNNLTDSIIRNEAPVTEVQAENDGFLETLRGVKKVYVSDYARQGMSVSDVNRTFGIGRWSGKEGLPVDVLYNNMVNDGITLPEADTIQDKLIAIRDRKAELTEVRREKLPRDEVRSIVDYAVDLGDYKTSGISEDVAIPEAGSESRTVVDEEFKSQRRALQEEIDNLPEDAYEERLRLTQEKNELEKDFVEGYIAHGKGKSARGIAMDFCTMNEAEEQVARAKLERSEDAAREARGYARENGMTQAMTSAARAMAEGNMTESELNTKYRNASDRVKIMELSELYKRVTYTTQNLKSEQRATLYEVCDVLFKNASYMKDLRTGHGQIDTFESLVNYICRVDSFKDSFSDKIPEGVRRELTWAAKQLNDIFYYSIQDNTDGMNQWKDEYKAKLKELGIRKRSAESAAAQALGEGFWNEDDLTRAGFDDEQREKIKELSSFLKGMYKEILPEINKIRFAQGEGDISAPTFKVDKQTAGELAKMQLMVDKIKYNSKAIDALKASEVKEYADKNGIRVEAIEAYRAYGKDEFAKHVNWRYKTNEGKSEGDMAQWAWNLIQNGKKYDARRGTIEMDYFPHLEKDDGQSTILQFLNIKKTIDKLPTAISGMTENFKPNKKWSPFMQERLGNETEWDAMTGAERYLDSIGMYMYHASDITKVRILENYIREAYGSNSSDKYALSNFAQYLRRYGDDLAGKQYIFDRALQETFVGRRFSQWWRALATTISRNQLGANISTTITNSALMGQGVSWAIRETIYEKDLSNLIKIFNTGMGNSKTYIEKSTFLRNRFHDDVQLLDASKAINVIAKIQNGMFKPMQLVDMMATTRVHKMMAAIYMNQGMSETDAIAEADIALRQLAASREYGEKPLVFSSNAFSVVTKYTLEPLNQMRYYKNQFGRMTQAIMDGSDTKMKATVKTAGMLMLAVAADALVMHLINYLFKKIKGYPVVMDPVQMAVDAWGNLAEGDLKGAWLDTVDEIPIANNIIKVMKGEVTDMIVIDNLINFLGGVCSIPSGQTNWEDFLWNAGMLFNPLGGTAQAKKMVQAYNYLTKGYQEKDGKVQHATDATPWDWAVGLLFGKSAIPSVQAWYDGGFKSLTKDGSEMFKEYRGKSGMSDTELYDVLKKYENAEYEINGEMKKKNLSEQSREIFRVIFDEYDQSFVNVYEMLLEYDKKKASKEEKYDAYKWVTEDVERYGTFSTYDKYYLWNKMKDRKCDVPERLTAEERKIAEVFIATGDEKVLFNDVSDEISRTAYGVKTTYYLDEYGEELLQSEYERIVQYKLGKYLSLGGDLGNDRWQEIMANVHSEAKKEAQATAIKEEWYENKSETDVVSVNEFDRFKNDITEKEMPVMESFWLYLDAVDKDYIMPDWEKPTLGQKILAETYAACDEEPASLLLVQKENTFSDNKVKYILNEEQHAEFQRLYEQYYWDAVENMKNISPKDRVAKIKKARTDAGNKAKYYIMDKYKGQLQTEK